jgi:hypothetical protein
MPNSKTYGRSILLARLYERVAKRSGNHYLTGRLGAAKITVLKSHDTTDDGVAIWNVVLAEPPPDKRARNDAPHSTAEGELTYTAVDPNDGTHSPPLLRRGRISGGFDCAFDDETPF